MDANIVVQVSMDHYQIPLKRNLKEYYKDRRFAFLLRKSHYLYCKAQTNNKHFKLFCNNC